MVLIIVAHAERMPPRAAGPEKQAKYADQTAPRTLLRAFASAVYGRILFRAHNGRLGKGLGARGLPVSGRKDVLIERLTGGSQSAPKVEDFMDEEDLAELRGPTALVDRAGFAKRQRHRHRSRGDGRRVSGQMRAASSEIRRAAST